MLREVRVVDEAVVGRPGRLHSREMFIRGWPLTVQVEVLGRRYIEPGILRSWNALGVPSCGRTSPLFFRREAGGERDVGARDAHGRGGRAPGEIRRRWRAAGKEWRRCEGQ